MFLYLFPKGSTLFHHNNVSLSGMSSFPNGRVPSIWTTWATIGFSFNPSQAMFSWSCKSLFLSCTINILLIVLSSSLSIHAFSRSSPSLGHIGSSWLIFSSGLLSSRFYFLISLHISSMNFLMSRNHESISSFELTTSIAPLLMSFTTLFSGIEALSVITFTLALSFQNIYFLPWFESFNA